jgi:hypothetical protein
MKRPLAESPPARSMKVGWPRVDSIQTGYQKAGCPASMPAWMPAISPLPPGPLPPPQARSPTAIHQRHPPHPEMPHPEMPEPWWDCR